MRALIHRNYPEVLVLSYILGDKHSPPVHFDALWEKAALKGADPAVNFVRAATYERPGPISYAADLTQHWQIIKSAARITRAYSCGQLAFLVTIKDPYAWVASVAKFKQWIRGDEQLPSWAIEQVRQACLGYNHKYESWLAFAREHQPRARLIRYEDLLSAPELVMAETAGNFGWRRVRNFVPIPAVVEPTVWDHLPVKEGPRPFRAAYYGDREYLRLLPEAHMQVISDTINWSLLREFKYMQL